MALPFSFSSNTSPTGGQLDSDLAALGAMGTTSCTATGTNAITLTAGANQPDISVYTNYVQFSFFGPNNSTGAVTLQIGALSPLPVYLPSGTQAASGDIASGAPYVIMYSSALNSGNGGFQIVSSIPSSGVTPATSGATRGLLVTNNASTPSTKITITALTATLVTSAGLPVYLAGASAPSVVIALTTTGANGMDVGSRPTSGWVYIYLISTGAVTAGLATATSPTAGGPTLPSGYIYSAYVGAMYCDGSQNLLRSRQTGNATQFTVVASTNTAVIPQIANSSGGAVGTFAVSGTVTLVAVSVTSVVPLTASSITIVANNSYGGSSSGSMYVAPTTAYGGANQGYQGSNHNSFPLYTNSALNDCRSAPMLLEASTIAWCTSNTTCLISCLGWTDYYVR